MIVICTLVDITASGIHRNSRPQGSTLSRRRWDFQRNEQRNWDTVVQLLGLRFQPIIIGTPQLFLQQSAGDYQFGGTFAGHSDLAVWQIACSYEYPVQVQWLEEDFHAIPIITGLLESVALPYECFLTSGENCNLTIKTKML